MEDNSLPTAAHTLRRRRMTWATWLKYTTSVQKLKYARITQTCQIFRNSSAIRPRPQSSDSSKTCQVLVREVDVKYTDAITASRDLREAEWMHGSYPTRARQTMRMHGLCYTLTKFVNMTEAASRMPLRSS